MTYDVLMGTLKPTHSLQTVENIVKRLSELGSPIIIVFKTSSACSQFQEESLQGGNTIHGEWDHIRRGNTWERWRFRRSATPLHLPRCVARFVTDS